MMALSDITEYTVSAGTTNIGSLAFRKCRMLSKINLPEGRMARHKVANCYRLLRNIHSSVVKARVSSTV